MTRVLLVYEPCFFLYALHGSLKGLLFARNRLFEPVGCRRDNYSTLRVLDLATDSFEKSGVQRFLHFGENAPFLFPHVMGDCLPKS